MGRKSTGYADSGARGGKRTTKRRELDRREALVSREIEDGGRRFLVERCRELAPTALLVIEGVMSDPEADAKDRLAAAKMVLEQGFGRAPTTREKPSEGGVTIVVQKFSEPQARILEAEIVGPRTVLAHLDDGTPVERVQ